MSSTLSDLGQSPACLVPKCGRILLPYGRILVPYDWIWSHMVPYGWVWSHMVGLYCIISYIIYHIIYYIIYYILYHLLSLLSLFPVKVLILGLLNCLSWDRALDYAPGKLPKLTFFLPKWEFFLPK